MDMWDNLDSPEGLIRSEGAQSKRPTDDAPTRQPMAAGLKPAQRKQPTSDQKKHRRQMAKNAHEEITMTGQPTEADLMTRLAAATTLVEQSALTMQIEALRTTHREHLSAEGSLDWDGMGVTPPTHLQTMARALGHGADLPPVTASVRLGHTDATDWMADLTPEVHEDAVLSATARAEATRWFESVWAPVKHDAQEFSSAAHNAAGRAGTGYGLQASAASSVFLDQVRHLASREGIVLHTAGDDSKTEPLTGADLRAYLSGDKLPYDVVMVDGKAHRKVSMQRRAFDETVETYVTDGRTTQGPVDPKSADDSMDEWTIGSDLNGNDPKSTTTTGDAPSLKEGDTPESGSTEQVDNPNFGQTGQDKSDHSGDYSTGNTDDKMSTQGRRLTAADYAGGSPKSGDEATCWKNDGKIQFFAGEWMHLKGGGSHDDVHPATPKEQEDAKTAGFFNKQKDSDAWRSGVEDQVKQQTQQNVQMNRDQGISTILGDQQEEAEKRRRATQPTASRHTAISVTNVGVDSDGNGTGTANGKRIKFRLSDKDRESLKAVLYSDMAMNFSGVDIDQSEVIDEGGTTASLFEHMASTFGRDGGRGIATYAQDFGDGTSSEQAATEAPSLAEGDAPEGGHSESPVQESGEGAKDMSAPTDADRPEGGVNWGATASLKQISAAFAGKPVSQTTATLASALGHLDSADQAIAGITGRQILASLLADPQVPGNVKRQMQAHLHTAGEETQVMAYPTCDICQYEDGKAGVEAHYDGKTQMGPWANMCDAHFKSHGTGLGTGSGQRLVKKEGSVPFAREAADDHEVDLAIYHDAPYARCRVCGKPAAFTDHDSEGRGKAVHTGTLKGANWSVGPEGVVIDGGQIRAGSITAAENPFAKKDDSGSGDSDKNPFAGGGSTCSVCGDKIAKDPGNEDPATWHHDNGEKHDHEAKPGGSKESSKTANTASPQEGSVKSRQNDRGDGYKEAKCANCGGSLRRRDQMSSGWTHSSTNTKNCPEGKQSSKTAADKPTSFDDLEKGKCSTCGAEILGFNGQWIHDPRKSAPVHPDGSVAGDAHAVRPLGKQSSLTVNASFAAAIRGGIGQV